MSNYHRQTSRASARTQGKSRQYINSLARSLALLGLVTSGSPLWLLPSVAAPTPAVTSNNPTTIDNQATGTFTDLVDPSLGTQSIVSNIVTVTVAEVAGITITPTNTPTATTGNVSNFDFTITNVGNDPTKFFLPTAPSSVIGGTAGTLQVVGYIPAGGAQVTLTTPINITAAADTGALSDPTLGSNTTLGSIPAGAAIVVRVPVTVSATGGSPVSVTLGNTTGQPTNSNTPYVAQTNDVYTVDHADPSSIVGEATGMPINGDASFHRQEASATQSVTSTSPGNATCDATANAAFVLGQSATINGSNEITLTPNLGSSRGSAWSSQQISLANSFSLKFKVYLGTDDAGADGIVFAFHRDPAGSAATGNAGGALGVGGLDPAIAIKFDTFQNTGELANDFSIIYNPKSNILPIPSAEAITPMIDLGNIEDGAWHSVEVNWNPTTKNLIYSFDGIVRSNVTRDLINTDFGGNPNVFYGFAASTGGATNEQKACIISAPPPVATAPVTMTGTVFDDANGSQLLNGTEVGSNGGGLNAVLVDSTNKVVASAVVAANGTYTFNNVSPNATYTVQITTNTATVGAVPPAIALPNNWVSTGENLNGTADATVDSKQTITVGTTAIANINFGIEQLPDTTDLTPASQTNPGGTTTVQVPTLAGTDPEDGALGSGKSFKIVTLPTNGTLTYNGSAVTAGQVISNYTPTLLLLDPNDGAISVSFTYAAVDAAGQVDPTPATVTIPFTVAIGGGGNSASSACLAAGGALSNTNLWTMANNGTFGTGSGASFVTNYPNYATFVYPSPLPSGATTYNYSVTSVTSTGANTATGTDNGDGTGLPSDGSYVVMNNLDGNRYNEWHAVRGHTTGSATDNFMLVNAAYDPGDFLVYTISGLTPNTNYEFSAWILNLHAGQNLPAANTIDPNVSFVTNTTFTGDVVRASTGNLVETGIMTVAPSFTPAPAWGQHSFIVNSGGATAITFKLRNNAPGGLGNDLALDDITVRGCTGTSSGAVSGTLYRDSNNNNALTAGEPVLANVTVQLVDGSGAIASTQTDSAGNYSFANIPVGTNYTLKVVASDSDIPAGATPTANPGGASTTGQQTGISITSGGTLANQNFGFSAPTVTNANVLVVKRITAINGDRTKNPNDNTPLNVFVDDTTSTKAADDNNSNWIANYLKGAINAGKVKPGDDIEYTIYFLNAGNANANTVRICDRLKPNQAFQPDGYGTGTGLQLQLGTSSVINLTNANDASDRTQFIAAGGTVPTNCNITGTNTDGTIVVDVTGAAATGNPAITTLPGATAAGSPNDSYGFFRFITKVNP